MNKYILTTAKGRVTGLVLENEKPAELRVYEDESALGSIYVGRVSNVVKNIKAAFVDIQKNLTCYMPLEEYNSGRELKTGDVVLVQYSKEAVKTKQPTVTGRLSLAGRYAALSLDAPVGVSSRIKSAEKRNELKALMEEQLGSFYKELENALTDKRVLDRLAGIGGVLRTRSETASTADICGELRALYFSFADILSRALYAGIYSCMYRPQKACMEDAVFFANQPDTAFITDIKEVYDYVQTSGNADISCNISYYADSLCTLNALYNVDGVIDKALCKTAYLKSGAYLVIEPTEAMTVIDVNSGKAVRGNNAEESMHRINLEAAQEIARQLRLRNISGIIMIDFISIKSDAKNKELLKALDSYIKRDYVPASVVDITMLGLVEVTRKKVRRPLLELMGYSRNDS